MLKAVIDTSVMVSVAFPKEGLAKDLRNLIGNGAFTLVTSKEIMDELIRVLHYPRIMKQFQASEDHIGEFIGLILEKAVFTKGAYHIRKIEEDPSDDMFLACALEAQAEYIVSRDPHLLNIKHFRRIQIINIKSFIEKVRGHSAKQHPFS